MIACWEHYYHSTAASIEGLFPFLGTYAGYYLYIETSAPRKSNDTAQLMSVPFKPVKAGNDCAMRFFYHMYGDHVNELNVWLKTSENPYGPMRKVWAKKGIHLHTCLF